MDSPPTDDEPCVLDTDLAKALGIKNPRAIRNEIIATNREELEGLGILSAVPTKSGKRGRPGTSYYLNEAQALLVCTLSRTPIAKQVRAELIEPNRKVLEGFGISRAVNANRDDRDGEHLRHSHADPGQFR